MSLKRTVLAVLGSYTRAGDHFVQTETERLGSTFDPQASVMYTCVDCGEEQRRKYLFSETCGDGNYIDILLRLKAEESRALGY